MRRCLTVLLCAAATTTAFHQSRLDDARKQQLLTRMTTLDTVLPRCEPMPAPLRSETPGTWAHDTMSRRVVEDILDAVVLKDADDGWRPALLALREEILANAPLTPLLPDGGSEDVEAWNALLAREPGQTWLSAPWLVSEFYLYRRIAAATQYFAQRSDCFAAAKEKGLASSLATLEQLVVDPARDPTASFLFIALWGNRMDLSLWPAGANVASRDGEFEKVLKKGREKLLADDSETVTAYLSTLSDATIDVVVDNAGFELCSDLLLADHFLASGIAKHVRLRVKHHPTFVSDVLALDVTATVDALKAQADRPALVALGTKWGAYLESGAMTLHDDFGYWAMPYALWEMPRPLRDDFRATSDLCVVKGDANYRRALGDRPWPFAAPFTDVCSYFPAPLLCLRTLKAELGCGMASTPPPGDPNWLTNGNWGVLQFAPPYDGGSSAATTS